MPDSHRSLPVVETIRLPVSELRAPMIPAASPARPSTRSWADAPDIRGLCELLEPEISAVIARKARQRRFTP